jgi:hypothetical protein
MPAHRLRARQGEPPSEPSLQDRDDGAFELTQRIERVIVHPENSEDIRPSAKAIALRGRRSLAMSLDETKFDRS